MGPDGDCKGKGRGGLCDDGKGSQVSVPSAPAPSEPVGYSCPASGYLATQACSGGGSTRSRTTPGPAIRCAVTSATTAIELKVIGCL